MVMPKQLQSIHSNLHPMSVTFNIWVGELYKYYSLIYYQYSRGPVPKMNSSQVDQSQCLYIQVNKKKNTSKCIHRSLKTRAIVYSSKQNIFRRLKQAGTYHSPSQESVILFLCAVASLWDMRKNFLPDIIYPNTQYVLLFQMALGKQPRNHMYRSS